MCFRKQPRLSTVDASLAATSNMAKTSAVPDGSFTATFITAKTALVQHPHVFNLTYSDELLRALGLEPGLLPGLFLWLFVLSKFLSIELWSSALMLGSSRLPLIVSHARKLNST